MRVAFITNLAPHYTKPLFEELARRLTVDYFFFSKGQERYLSAKLRHHEGSYNSIPLTRIRIGHQTITPGLVRYLRPDRYDVVVKCLNGRLMVPLVYLTAKLRGMPIVLWTGAWDHPNTPFHRLTHDLTNQLLRQADAIVTYGDHVRAYLARIPGMSAGKLFVAGQAVDAWRFHPASPDDPPSETSDVVYVGQLEERKGVDYLVDAFLTLRDPDARLILVGSGSLEHHFAERSRSDSRIRMVGHLSQDELPGLLRRARCLVLPSVITPVYGREPWGLVVNEAMHSGIPVIASSAVGAAAGGLVQDGKNGRIVSERDAPALAAALADLIQDAELARRMGLQASQDVKQFNFRAMADAFEAACRYAVMQHR